MGRPLIAEERKSWNIIWILLTSRLVSAWCLLSPVISKGNLHYLLLMKNDNHLHKLALIKESCAFCSKGTWKVCELFPACGSSAALFPEDVMVPLGGRRSHSLLSRLDHFSFLWLGAGRLSSYCYLEFMPTHLCSRCAPANQMLPLVLQMFVWVYCIWSYFSITDGNIYLIFWWFVNLKSGSRIFSSWFPTTAGLFSDKLNFPFSLTHFWRRFLCRTGIDSLLIDRDCSL